MSELEFINIPDMINTISGNVREMYDTYVKALEATKAAIDRIENARLNYILKTAENAAYTEEDEYPMDDNEVVSGYAEYKQNLIELRQKLEVIIHDNFEQLFKLNPVQNDSLHIQYETALRCMSQLFYSEEDFATFHKLTENDINNALAATCQSVPYLCNFLSYNELQAVDDVFYVIYINDIKHVFARVARDCYVVIRYRDISQIKTIQMES